MARGGQEGLPLRPIRQVKATPGGRKKGAKLLLGSNPFGKVALEIFLFSACTLIYISASDLKQTPANKVDVGKDPGVYDIGHGEVVVIVHTC